MKYNSASHGRLCSVAGLLLGLSCFTAAQTPSDLPKGPGKVIVHPKFSGGILGFDIDQNSSEGVLAEAQLLSNGNVLSAVETFDQKTGKIIKLVAKTETQDDDVTFGVVGTSAGLIEHEHVGSNGFVDKRIYHVLSPLNSNKYTSLWTPSFDANHIITGVSRNQGSPTNAFFVYDNSLNDPHNFVLASNVAENTFGPRVVLNVPQWGYGTPLAFDTKTNQAVVAQDYGSPTDQPIVGIIDLTKGKVVTFTGVGFGFVNGIAVDSEDGIVCTTTEIDSNVQFYHLKTKTGFTELLAESEGQLNSGADVEFDPIHKLFLIAQPISTAGGSSIQVYDTKGNLVESLNGFNFSNASSVIPVHIALNPAHRSGFVDDPAGIRSFTY
jgi:hypothetical protein